MDHQEIGQQLLDHARYGETEEFMNLARTYFQSINEDPESPTAESLGRMYAAARTKDGTTIRHYAAANNHTDLLNLFIRRLSKEDINHRNKEGSTPLHWAALNGSLESVVALADAGADLGLKNMLGRSAMTIAEMHGHTLVADEILKRAEMTEDDHKVVVEYTNDI